MTTYNTGNPLGSTDPRDLYDNAENLDEFVNSPSKDSHPDRRGVSRKTWHGMESEFQADQTRREDEFDVAQSYRASQYIAAEDARNFQTNEFIANHGNYVPVGDYAAGIEISQYNEVVRDATGEFWRLSGSRELPYTTTGSGLPEGGAFVPVGDAALRQQLAQDNGYRLVADQMAPNAYGVPGKLTNYQTYSGPRAEDYFQGYFWGTTSDNNIHRSVDGVTWEQYASAPVRFSRILPTGDNEVLGLTPTTVLKSSGWASGSPTWSTVLTNPSGSACPFLRWGFDGDGDKFIIGHYGAGSSAWADSRYVWISTDAGDTWVIVWDTDAVFPGQSSHSHIHATCYDPWQDRFWFTEGHGPMVGIRYSDDNGANWTRMVNDWDMNPAFTTMTATDFGIVCGTDGPPNGIFLIRRQDDPDQTGVEYYGVFGKESIQTGVTGFADRGYRDPDTGIVYVGFRTNFTSIRPCIFAVGSEGASIAYQVGEGHGSTDRFFSVVAAKGKILGDYAGVGGGNFRANTSKFGSRLIQDYGNFITDQGRPTRNDSLRAGLGSRADGINTIAIGTNADAGSNQNTIAIGRTAYAPTNGGVAVGTNSEAGQTAVALGDAAAAQPPSSVAIGRAASARSSEGSVAIGPSSEATSGAAIGWGAKSTGVNAVAIGRSANASQTTAIAIGASSSAVQWGCAIGDSANAAFQSVAIGRNAAAAQADTTAIGAGAETVSGLGNQTAIGRNAKTLHSNTVAIGEGSVAERANSICVGSRDIESTRNGGRIYLKSPDGTLRYISINNSGEVTVTTV